MSSPAYKLRSAALLSAMVIVCGSAQPVTGEDRPDTDLENRGDAAVWSESASAESSGGGLCPDGVLFRKNANCPLGGAILTPVGTTLVVSSLTVPDSSASSAVVAACTAPSSGDEIEPADPEKAGDNGFKVKLDDTEIPTDVTAFYVQLDDYWGTSKTNPAWQTDPIPIGFRSSQSEGNTTVTGCADFDECPIFCTKVVVEFQGGGAPGTIECDPGDLFSVTGPDVVVTLRKVIAKGTCHNGNGSCNECNARRKSELQFVLAEVVGGWQKAAGCTSKDTGPFTANKIFIRPKLSSCREVADSPTCSTPGGGANCPDPSSATGDVQTAGGNTPPLRKISLLAEEAVLRSGQTNAAAIAGSFVILDESICIDPECLGTIPTVSAWGVGVLALVLCASATVLLRRSKPTIEA